MGRFCIRPCFAVGLVVGSTTVLTPAPAATAPPKPQHRQGPGHSSASELARLKSRVEQLERLLVTDAKQLTSRELGSASEAVFDRWGKLNEEQRRRDGPEKPLPPEKIYERCSKTVVSVVAVTDRGRVAGTGFFSQVGGVITNFHVVAGAKQITINVPGGRRVEVEAVDWVDRDRDLALLRLTGDFTDATGKPTHDIAETPLFGEELLPIGTPVYVIGDPAGLEKSLANGLISGVRKLDAMTTLYQMTVPVSAGSSGSPVFNQYGRVVGVVTSGVKDAQNLNFCVPVDYLQTGVVRASLPISEWADFSRTRTPNTSVAAADLPPRVNAFLGRVREELTKPFREDDLGWRSLRGLSGVGVLVEMISPDAEAAGLTRDKVQTDAELRLRAAGLKVLTKEERYATAGGPYLYVNVNAYSQGGLITYAVGVSLRATAFLEHNGVAAFNAQVWDTGSVGRSDAEGVRRSVRDAVDSFCNDYLKANPAPPKE
jgi:S1-C subfamily serine protease